MFQPHLDLGQRERSHTAVRHFLCVSVSLCVNEVEADGPVSVGYIEIN